MSQSDLTFVPLSWFILLQLLAFTCHARGPAKFPAVIAFGDSSVDPGNNNHIPTIVKSNFRPYGRDFPGGRPTGRFSNGRLITDFISEVVSVKPEVPAYLDPAYDIHDFATGVSFASAGTGLDNATAAVHDVIPLWKELQYFREYKRRLGGFMGKTNASKLLNDALYVISIGTNDFVENYYSLPTTSARFTVAQYQDFLIAIVRDFVKEIYDLGGRKFSMTSLPPMGCFPLERTANMPGSYGCNLEKNEAAVGYNEKLKAMAEELKSRLTEISLSFVNQFRTIEKILERPSSFGIENTDDGCCATGEFKLGYLCNDLIPFACPNASNFVFWDALHPSEMIYKIIAKHMLNTSLPSLMKV